MADKTTFPRTFMEFIKEYSFKDKEEIYTDGDDLISVFRVEQAWEHYTADAANALDNIRECIRIIDNNLYDIEDAVK